MSNNNTTTTTGPESDVRVNITVGDSVLKATMLDNETARDFVSMLPMTLQMRDLYHREKTGRPSCALSTGGPSQTTFEIGDLAYSAPGPSALIFYDDVNTSLDGTSIQVICQLEPGIDLFTISDGSVKATFNR